MHRLTRGRLTKKDVVYIGNQQGAPLSVLMLSSLPSPSPSHTERNGGGGRRGRQFSISTDRRWGGGGGSPHPNIFKKCVCINYDFLFQSFSCLSMIKTRQEFICTCIARLNILLVGSLLEKRADLSNNSLQLYIPNLYCKQFSTQFLGAVQYKHWCTCIYSSLEDTMPLYRHYHAAALSAILKLFQFSNFPLENIALLGAACAIYLVHGILLLLYLQREKTLYFTLPSV